jgi:hypothetical protein
MNICGFSKMVLPLTQREFSWLFPQRLISRYGDVPWPPRSPDLSAPDFFLWGYLKSKVFGSRPAKLNELKLRTRDEIGNITDDMLQLVMRSFSIRVHRCVQRNGAHSTDLIFKK